MGKLTLQSTNYCRLFVNETKQLTNLLIYNTQVSNLQYNHHYLNSAILVFFFLVIKIGSHKHLMGGFSYAKS